MTSKTRKTYIGKERDDESFLGDFGVRKYDYAAGRFTAPDVLWEKYMGWSPYHYCMNNPIIATDQDGKQTTREFQTMFIHPISAFVVYNNSQKALGYAFSLYSEDGIHNGKGDAFRHALWNAMNTRDLGKVIAKKYADAHEDYKGNPTGEKNMDLKNNEIGREIGENNPKASDHELIKIIKERLENGELQLAPTNKTQKTEHPYMKKDYNYNGVEDVKTNK